MKDDREKRFNEWYDSNFRDPDGSDAGNPSWLKHDLLSAWNAAIDAARTTSFNDAIEAAAKRVPTNWLDPLLTGSGVKRPPLGEREIEALLRGIQDRIRALALPAPGGKK